MDIQPQIRIMVVDDHPLVRAGLCVIIGLQTDMRVVGEFGDAETAISNIETMNPDVLLMDLRLPSMSGLEGDSITPEEFSGNPSHRTHDI
jgi:DNA-binding NarL/FixJ family response regulator